MLSQLRDIHLPLDASAMAAALPAGSLLLGLLIAALLLGLSWHLWQRRPQQRALRRLRALRRRHAADSDAVALARDIGTLLRTHAQQRYPGAGVAGRVAADWLAFLDEHGGKGDFSAGVGTALATLPYQAQGDVDAPALIELARRWLRANPL